MPRRRLLPGQWLEGNCKFFVHPVIIGDIVFFDTSKTAQKCRERKMAVMLSVNGAIQLLILFIMIAVAGCSSTQKTASTPTEPISSKPAATQPPTAEGTEEAKIDLLGLQRSLDMIRDGSNLGYQEKEFNTCQTGYGFSATKNCKKAYLSVIHFRLQCRDSKGTVSTATHILTPIISAQLKWSIGAIKGITSTDGEGFGQIVTVLPKPSKRERFRMTANSKYLVLRAGEVSRFVVPSDWCD